MRLLIFFLFSIFFSTNILAYDFSGLYEGKQCKRMCKDKSQLDKFFESVPVLGSLKGDNKSYTILYVDHDEKANKITIFAPKLDYLFGNMSLTGNFFKGYATNKSNNQQISFILEKYKVVYEINGNKTIKTISNPINLINWIIFTLKDIF